jgi:hypothetical protein
MTSRSKVQRLATGCARPPRPTLRGLTTGTVKVITTARQEPVVLWGDDFSSWLGVVQELSLRPVAVILSRLDLVALVQATVGTDCFVGLASEVEAVLGALSGKCRLGLVDGHPTRKFCELGDRFGLDCIIGTKNVRRRIDGWRHDSFAFKHCDVAGVTITPSHGVCLLRGDQLPLRSALPFYVPRDVSTMLSVMAPTHKFRAAPEEPVLTPLGCANLGTLEHPYYHGGGLLPPSIDRRTRILAPGLYAPKGHWALRPLTLEEVVLAKDFGRILPNLLAVGRLENDLLQRLVPGKSLVALATRWGCHGGGGLLFTKSVY